MGVNDLGMHANLVHVLNTSFSIFSGSQLLKFGLVLFDFSKILVKFSDA